MIKTFTLKITSILFLVFLFHNSLKAQTNTSGNRDSTKVILVVVPQKDTVKTHQKTAPVKRARPAYIPTTAERAGTATYSGPSTPVKTTSPRAFDSAPTTAERSGTPTYMNSTPPVKKAVPPPQVNNSVIPVPSTSTVIKVPVNGAIKIVHDTLTIKKSDTIFVKEATSTTVTNKILFLEIGGPGLALSLNYDKRFSDQRDGLGFRIGVGYFGDGGNTVFTVPLQINYLIGDGSHFIELGAGTSFINSTGDNTGKTFIFDRVSGLIGTATIGYRYQPENGNLNFRIGFVPIFSDQGITPAGGISIGYSFKALK